MRIDDWVRLKTYFAKPSLQMVSFTITEKGYNLLTMNGEHIPEIKIDIENGPEHPINIISKITSLA